MRSPRVASAAGSSVSAASTETRTTAIAPAAIERKIVCGTRNMPAQREHDRRAGEQDGPVRGGTRDGDRVAEVAAGAALLAEARDDEQRVVDPDGQPHHHEHVHDDEVEDEGLADAGDDRQRDDDARDRDADRHHRGRDAAEDDDQDDQREREPEHLAAREVLVRRPADVLVDRLLADDQRAEPVASVRGGDALDDRLDVAPELDEEQRAVAIARHRAGADLGGAGGAQLARRACPCRRSKRGSSALRRGDETITASSTRKPRSARTGGNARSRTCSARCALRAAR